MLTKEASGSWQEDDKEGPLNGYPESLLRGRLTSCDF